MTNALRIANCSGFYGDRLSAAREMVEGGPIDVLTGDYLAELTMSILWRTRLRDPDAGFASTFLTQMEEVLGTCLERGIKVVSNAGGLNPSGLAERLEKLVADLGLNASVASVEGDDLLPRLDALVADGHEFRHFDNGRSLAGSGVVPLTANAYLGGFGIKAALDRGADVVITGRVTDAAVVVGPAAWRFGWERDNWDALAGAVVAGHVIECGAQATGGNFAFFTEIGDLDSPGFPIAEIKTDGSSVITKHPGSGGSVTVGTVTAQLLYEIGSPRYFNPDVTSHFETIALEQVGPDRVAISGVKGSPPPSSLKVALNYLGGYRNSMTFGLAGLDLDAKAQVLESALWKAVGGKEQFAVAESRLVDASQPDPDDVDESIAYLRFTVKDADEALVGRSFSRGAVELALSNYPGLFMTGPPREATAYSVYWPTTIPADLVPMKVNVDGQEVVVSSQAPAGWPDPDPNENSPAPHHVAATRSLPLGTLAGARSGDKGGNANVGIWVRHPDEYQWLNGFLTIEQFRSLLPEAEGLDVKRYQLPNLLALNFVVVGLLGEGVSSSTRTDPQAKSLGEFLRARFVPIPIELLGN